MVGRPAILRRKSLAYPAGRATPGFNPSHPMATGAQLSAVFSNGTFVNLCPGYASTIGTVSGTAANKLDSIIGPVKDVGTTYKVTFTGGAANATGAPITMAAIVRTGVSDNAGIVSLGTAGPGLADFGGPFELSTPSTDYNSGITLLDSTPYFLVACHRGDVSGLVNFLVLNLSTGKMQTAAIAGTNQTTYAGTGFSVGFEGKFSTFWNGRIAAVFSSNAYHPMQDLLAWAADPWDFWYPESLVKDIPVLSRAVVAVYFPFNGAFVLP